MAVLTGALRTVNTIAQFYKDFTSYLTSYGGTLILSANGRRSATSAPQSDQGTPRSNSSNNLRNKTTFVILLAGYATLKRTLELGKATKTFSNSHHVVTQHFKNIHGTRVN